MPTTSKMGIVYPSSSDLVKDGATAMGTISTTVDNKTGLVLISTQTFTTSSGVSFPTNTFSSNFTNYKIVGRTTPSTTLEIRFRMRAAGVDDTSSNYTYQYVRGAISTASASQNVTTYGFMTNSTFSVVSAFSFDVLNPQIASPTILIGQDMEITTLGTTQALHTSFQYHNVATAYDSITFYPSTGTMTGAISIYGYNKE